jgi:hypothetical protein
MLSLAEGNSATATRCARVLDAGSNSPAGDGLSALARKAWAS